MKPVLTTISISVCCLLNVIHAQPSDCLKSLRRGTFFYVGQHEDCIITRTGTIQKEVWNRGKSIMIMKIKWVSDNEYLLIVKKLINVTGQSKVKDVLDV